MVSALSTTQQLPYRRILFGVGSSYHVGWKIYDLSAVPVNLTGSSIEFAVYAQGAPINPSQIPWLVKTNAPGGGLVVLVDPSDQTSSIIRADFAPQDSFNQVGIFPFEMKAQLPDAPDWRQLSHGFLIITAARLDP